MVLPCRATLLLFLSVSLLSCSPKQHCEFETRMCESYIIYLEQYPIQKGTYCTYLQTYFAWTWNKTIAHLNSVQLVCSPVCFGLKSGQERTCELAWPPLVLYIFIPSLHFFRPWTVNFCEFRHVYYSLLDTSDFSCRPLLYKFFVFSLNCRFKCWRFI